MILRKVRIKPNTTDSLCWYYGTLGYRDLTGAVLEVQEYEGNEGTEMSRFGDEWYLYEGNKYVRKTDVEIITDGQ